MSDGGEIDGPGQGRLQGLTAIVTGASRGIGHAIAGRFAAEGAAVFIGSRTAPADLSEVIEWRHCDVVDATSVEALINAAMAATGSLDVLVNNAGVQLEKTIEHTTDDDFDSLIDVNVRGVFNGCRAAIAPMRNSGGGSIINIGSVAGFSADHGMAIYNASKAAVHGLTRAVATDHGVDGIRCNAISPGWVATELAERAFAMADDPAAARHAAVHRHPVGRLGLPGDVAALATWLASDESTFASGGLFTLDGGLTAQSPI